MLTKNQQDTQCEMKEKLIKVVISGLNSRLRGTFILNEVMMFISNKISFFRLNSGKKLLTKLLNHEEL